MAVPLASGELRINVDLGALPEAPPQEQGGGEGIADLLTGFEAVIPRIGRTEGAVPLGDGGGLAMKAPGLGRGRVSLAPERAGDRQADDSQQQGAEQGPMVGHGNTVTERRGEAATGR